MPDIILSTLNARYIHSALGLRYLLANMGELQHQTTIKEYVIHSRPIDIVEDLLALQPRIIGFSVYIWNVEPLTQVVSLLKRVRPDIIVVLGGPEVSYETEQQAICQDADYVICGAADLEFASLCQSLISIKPSADSTPLYTIKKITAAPVDLTELQMPYPFYTDEDIRQRIIYVEASRGCPYKCEFCLSALDKTAVPFELDNFLLEMQRLYERGARRFKFVDRTFNLKIESSIRILEFFLQRLSNDLFLHFELIPDHLPDRLKDVITRFPPGSLQFEIGIQSFNPQVQTIIKRKQNTERTLENLRWLREHSHAHLHTDLIIGLPGEDMQSIAAGFDQLVGLNPHEIQVGILKRLRGSPIIRHTETHAMVYNPHPPYNILQTSKIDFATMQRLTRFARYWDIIANSGRFKHTLPLILQNQAFNNFLTLSDWLFRTTGQTHKIALDRLFTLLYAASSDLFSDRKDAIQVSLGQDFLLTGAKHLPDFFHDIQNIEKRTSDKTLVPEKRRAGNSVIPKRQARHLN